MKIFVAGSRGIPNIPGGVEKHCEELYSRIAAKRHTVYLATRSCYVTGNCTCWQGIRLIKCFAPKKKCLEAIVHTFLALIKAIQFHPDIVHIHAIGPCLLTPLARLLGSKIVITNHGPDYERQKWGVIAKAVLKVGEKLGAMFADEIIVISNVIKNIIRARCGRESILIYNGVDVPNISSNTNYIDALELIPKGYILSVARFVPEKGLHDLIRAFHQIDGELKLVIAGDADHESDYSRNIKALAQNHHRIVLTGYVTDEYLKQLYSHAKLFVLPSYHEGLPIVLLEALSYGLPSLVSDIPANLEIGLDRKYYFSCGNINDLKNKLCSLIAYDSDDTQKDIFQKLIVERYNWDEIAKQTLDVYQRALYSRA